MVRFIYLAACIFLSAGPTRSEAQGVWPTTIEPWAGWFMPRQFSVDTTTVPDATGREGRRGGLEAERRGEYGEQPSIGYTKVTVVVWPDVARAQTFIAGQQAESVRGGYTGAAAVALPPGINGWTQVEDRLDDIVNDRTWNFSCEGKVSATMIRGATTVQIFMGVGDRQSWMMPPDIVVANPVERRRLMEVRNATRARLRPIAVQEMAKFMRQLAAFEGEDILPTIFIHGIGGSVLALRGTVNDTDLWPLAPTPTASRAQLALEPNGAKPAGSAVFAKAVIDNVGYAEDIYGPLMSFFQSSGREVGRHLWYFPYDWRLDNAEHLALLDALVEKVLRETGKTKVNLVTHSMGGLVAKGYVHGIGAHKVSKLITMALPYRDGAFVFRGVAEGYDFGNPSMRPELMKILLQNWPSAYQIYPRYRFIHDSTRKQVLTLKQAHSIRYRGYTNVSPGFFQDTYVETAQPEWSNNTALVALADRYHGRFNTPRAPAPVPAGVKHYAIIGWGLHTEVGYTMSDLAMPATGAGYLYGDRLVEMAPRFGDGDGKVPLRESADTIPATRKFYIRHLADVPGGSAEHTGIAANKMVHEIIDLLLKNEPVPHGGYDARPTREQSGQIIARSLFVANRSAVTLQITDPAKRTVLAFQPPAGARRIAGADLIRLAGVEFAWLPAAGGPYEIGVKGMREGKFTLGVALTDGTQRIAFGFPSLAANASTTGKFTLASNEIAAARMPFLEVTTDGRGVRVPPRAVALTDVSAAFAADIPEPPVAEGDEDAVEFTAAVPVVADARGVNLGPGAGGAGGGGITVPGMVAATTGERREPVAPSGPTAQGPGTEPVLREFRYVDNSQDKVGAWGQGTPNGARDGWFRIALSLPAPVKIRSVAVRGVDAADRPTSVHWNSREPALYLLGVERDGRRLNASHAPELGEFRGEVMLDLFADDIGEFVNEKRMMVEVVFDDGARLSRIVTIGQTPTGPLPPTEGIGAAPIVAPDGWPPLPPWRNAARAGGVGSGAVAAPGAPGASATGAATGAAVPAAGASGGASFSIGGITLNLNAPIGSDGAGGVRMNVPADVAELLRQAAALAQQGKHVEARGRYATVLQKMPEQSDALLGTATSLIAERQTSAALGYLMRYLLTKPEGENKSRAEKMLQQLRGGN